MKEITNNNEQLSAYLDDALSDDEIASLIGQQNSAQKQGDFSAATRYHMMGEALRGELSDAAMVDVSSQISEALRNESMDVVSTKSVKTQMSPVPGFSFSAWLESFAKPLAGMAVAASVAVLMVVTVVQMESPEGGQQLAQQSDPLQIEVPKTLVAENPVVNTPSNEHDFDAYLAEHAEFAAQDTLQGRIPYVRAVSYQAE